MSNKSLRIYFRLLIVAFLPFTVHGQDTVNLKKQANVIVTATREGKYKIVVDHTYPKIVQLGGGKEAMLKKIISGMDEMKKQGIAGVDGKLGPPGKFYKAGSEIHCLIPETVTLIKSDGRLVSTSYLLAITNDKGKTWSFIDVGNITTGMLRDLFPHFNKRLKIPDKTEPVFYPN